MAKKRLNKSHREIIIKWMIEEKLNPESFENKQKPKITKLAELINVILRKKYPESDMKILRKYNVVRKDTCLRFQILDTKQVFEVSFMGWSSNFSLNAREGFENNIADIPEMGGCNNNVIFEGTELIRDLYTEIEDEYNEYYQERRQKKAKYESFVFCCKTLEDVEAVVALPEHIRVSIAEGTTALVAINKELINDIKSDFN